MQILFPIVYMRWGLLRKVMVHTDLLLIAKDRWVLFVGLV